MTCGSSTSSMKLTEKGTAFANIILKIIDGQLCTLDAKYTRMFTKSKNVPIVMIANELLESLEKPGPMQERFMCMRFNSRIPNLEEPRIIATLWGCIRRRAIQSPYTWAKDGINTPVNINLEKTECALTQLHRPFISPGRPDLCLLPKES